MRKTLSILLAITLMLTISLSFAEAKHVRPLAFTPENCDLNNGVFWFDIQAADGNAAGSFTMKLYLEDRYSIAEIEALEPDDTVEASGKNYTVEAVVIHGWYDSDGDGEPDTGDITVRDPKTAQYLLEKYETVVTDQELIPYSYEIYYKEPYEGYVAFVIGDDGYYHPLINDETTRVQVGTAEIHLPLPDSFTYAYQKDWEGDLVDGTAQDFLDRLDLFCRYNSVARFENGKLAEVRDYQ